MRLLLFCISILFSGIFYTFFNLSRWKNIFWWEILAPVELELLSSNLLIEVFVFLLLSLFFIFYFSPLHTNTKINLWDKLKVLYILFYFFLFFSYFFGIFSSDIFILFTIILFSFWDFCFTILSKMEYFNKQKIWLRYFWLSLNYISIFVSLYYIFNIKLSFLLIWILVFSAIFNYFVHKAYTNYVSLMMSIWISIFLLYFLIIQIYSQVLSFI